MILFPYKTDSAVQKIPFVNFIFTSVLIVVSLLFYLGFFTDLFVQLVTAPKWSVLKAAGSIFMQPDLISIIIPAILLFTLGNALNSVLGNIYYAIFLLLLTAVSAAVQGLTSQIPAIGIHGIMMGLCGGTMAILPSNRLLLYDPEVDDETGLTIWGLVVLWLAFDIYSMLTYLSIIGKWTHLGCLAAGGIISHLYIKLKLIPATETTFFEWVADRISFFTESEFFASLLPTRKIKSVNDEIKMKAEQLLALHEASTNNFIETEIKEDLPQKVEIKGIKFRLLRKVSQKDFLSLYFVYEGEEISGLSVYSDFYKCEILPGDILKTGDSGSIKIFSSHPDKINNAQLFFKYKSAGGPGTKTIAFSSSSNQLSVNE